MGSLSEAVLGVDIMPNDIDIGVHTRDFYKVKDLTRKYVIEPLVDNKGNWFVRYFGKLCIDGASIDIAADEKLNIENRKKQFEKVSWNGYDLFATSLQVRYEVEIQRNRKDILKRFHGMDMTCLLHLCKLDMKLRFSATEKTE